MSARKVRASEYRLISDVIGTIVSSAHFEGAMWDGDGLPEDWDRLHRIMQELKFRQSLSESEERLSDARRSLLAAEDEFSGSRAAVEALSTK